MSSKKFIIPLQVLLLIGLSIAYFSVIYYKSSNRVATDFTSIYSSAQAFFAKHAIYAPPRMQSYNEIKGVPLKVDPSLKHSENLNPPFTVALTLPLALLNYQQALQVWSLISIILGVLASILISKELFSASKLALVGLLLALFAFFPTYINVVYGQLGLLMLLLATLIWLAGRNQYDGAAGCMLGIAIGMKLFFGLVFVFFLLQKRWRLLIWSIGSFIITVILGGMIFGGSVYHDYLTVLQQIDWYSASWNISWLGMLTRLFSSNVFVIISYFIGVSMLLAMLLYWWRSYQPEVKYYDFGFSLTLILMLLISPLGWLYYLPILMLPAGIIFKNYLQSNISLWQFWSIATAWLFINMPLKLHHHLQASWMNLLNKPALVFYSLLLLACACLALQRSSSKLSSKLSWVLILIYLPAYVCIIYVIPQTL